MSRQIAPSGILENADIRVFLEKGFRDCVKIMKKAGVRETTPSYVVTMIDDSRHLYIFTYTYN